MSQHSMHGESHTFCVVAETPTNGQRIIFSSPKKDVFLFVCFFYFMAFQAFIDTVKSRALTETPLLFE